MATQLNLRPTRDTDQGRTLRYVSLADIEVVPCTIPPALQLSIAELGILQPVVLRENGEAPAIILAGRRRVAAARAAFAADRAIPALVLLEGAVFADDWTSDESITLSENAHRSENHAAALDAIEKLIQAGATMEQIQRDLHLHKGSLARLLKLAALPESLREALRKGTLKPSLAFKITKLPEAEQKSIAHLQAMGVPPTTESVNNARLARRQQAVANLGDADAAVASDYQLDWRPLVIQKLTEVQSLLPKEALALQIKLLALQKAVEELGA